MNEYKSCGNCKYYIRIGKIHICIAYMVQLGFYAPDVRTECTKWGEASDDLDGRLSEIRDQ